MKPLGIKAYGSIPHLPGSRRGPADHGINGLQATLLTTMMRDKHDKVYCEEKLDGSCCAVARVNGEIIALGRAGYLANTSPYQQHHAFDRWVRQFRENFEFLHEGDRVVGEWILQAHGTRYMGKGQPFVAFDVFENGERLPYIARNTVLDYNSIRRPMPIKVGGPISIRAALDMLPRPYEICNGMTSTDKREGAVWRLERDGKFAFIAKYVRPEKVDGCFLPEISGGEPVLNFGYKSFDEEF